MEDNEVGLDRAMISSADGAMEAEFVPAAGMLCSSLRHRGEELLGQGSGVAAYASAGTTMGIPLLYPWANRLARRGYEAAGRAVEGVADSPRVAREENGLPIHGLLPCEMSWMLKSGRLRGGALSARLDWDAPALLELFPYPHRIEYAADVTANSLTIVVRVEANFGAPVPISFGFHPYISIASTERADWTVELPVTERLVLDDCMLPTGSREPVDLPRFQLGETSWDDAFVAPPPPAHFEVSSPRRTAAVDFLHGYGYAQVYSPPDSDFVCFEPMTAPTNALASGEGLAVLDAGEAYSASFRVAVTPRPSG